MEKLKKISKRTLSYVIVFIVMLLVFCLGMIITYTLPNQRIEEHIKESKDVILRSNANPLFGEYIKNATLDEATDLLILNTAINRGKEENENILIRAFENSFFLEEAGDQIGSIEKLMEDKNIYNNTGYSRYWHGIQTVVRPLLLFFNYEEIRYLFMMIMFILLGIATICIYKNLNITHAIAFVFSMIAVGFFIVPASMQYVGVFAITLMSVILVNILYKIKRQNWYPYLFFLIGGFTTFFDLLTVPALTLGIPLIIVMLLKNKEGTNIKKLMIEMIKLSILWCVSYATIFFAKWVIASIIMKENLITVAINQIIFRTNGSEEYPITRLGAIMENITYLKNSVLLGLLGLIGIIWIVFMIKNRKKINNIKVIVPLLLIALYPYIWYLFFAGHSTLHAWFTFRLQAITIFAVISAMIECVDIKKEKKVGRGINGKNSSNNTML